MRIQLVVMSALVVLTGCRTPPAPLGAMQLSLGYQPQREEAEVAPACAAISGLVVTDPRPNPQLIGSRYSEDSPQAIYAVTTQIPVSEWVRAAADSLLNRSLRATAVPGRGEVRLSVRRFEVTETVASNGSFNATVVLDAMVVMPDGRMCFAATSEGQARNYGRAENPVNFSEALSKALERSVKDLIERPGFVEATCGQCAPGATGSSGTNL